jgi:TRAP transporter TAXI family solute receptor
MLQQVSFRAGVTILTIAAAGVPAGGCRRQATSAPPQPVVLQFSTGAPGGGFYPIGQSLAGLFETIPDGMRLAIRPSAGAVDNVRAVQEGRADIGFGFADIAYLAYVGRLDPRTPPFDQLRAIALLQLTPVQLLAGRGTRIAGVEDLRGKRVGVGPSGSGTALTAGLIFQAFNLEPGAVRTESLQFTEAGRRLAAGDLEAMFDNAIYAESAALALRSGARLVAIQGPATDRLQREYPFLRVMAIPADTYQGVGAVPTVGVDSLLICRRDLGEEVVHTLTRRLFQSLPLLAAPMRRNLAELAEASATPIPLHDGAARYYREQELLR